jgi:hypothetical protein
MAVDIVYTTSMTTCRHRHHDPASRYFDLPCQLPAGHDYGHWYAPLVTQAYADRLQGRS